MENCLKLLECTTRNSFPARNICVYNRKNLSDESSIDVKKIKLIKKELKILWVVILHTKCVLTFTTNKLYTAHTHTCTYIAI